MNQRLFVCFFCVLQTKETRNGGKTRQEVTGNSSLVLPPSKDMLVRLICDYECSVDVTVSVCMSGLSYTDVLPKVYPASQLMSADTLLLTVPRHPCLILNMTLKSG